MGNTSARKLSSPDFSPRRLFSRRSEALATTDMENVPKVAAKVLARVRDIRNAHSEGSYVFGDPDHHVFAQRIGSPGGEAMLKEHGDWLLAVYASGPPKASHACFPDVEEIADDIRDHYGWEAVPRWLPPTQLELFPLIKPLKLG